MKQDFSEVKVGDKLWSIELGDCEVTEIINSDYPIVCINANKLRMESYTLKGLKSDHYAFQSLFFSNPFEGRDLPPPPKRMVKKPVKVRS